MLRLIISYLDQLFAGLFKLIQNAPLIIKLPVLIVGFTIMATIAMVAEIKGKKTDQIL
jgi:hypothetical protein